MGKTFKKILLAGVFSLFIVSCGSGISREDDDNNQNDINTPQQKQENKFARAELGALSGAKVEIFELGTTPYKKLFTEITSGGDSIEKVGNFNAHYEELKADKYYLFKVSGGLDVDANDDGKIDKTPTLNKGSFHAVVKGTDAQEIQGNLKITVASELIYKKVASNINDISTLDVRIDKSVKEVLRGSIDSDENIDNQDILKYNPIRDQKYFHESYQERVIEVIKDIHEDKKDDTKLAPTADAGIDRSIEEGKELRLVAKGLDLDGNIVKYIWSEDDEQISDEKEFVYHADSLGVHILTLTVTDNDNLKSSDRVKITVVEKPNTQPVAKNRTIEVNEDTQIEFKLEGEDKDQDILTYKILLNPVYGQLIGKAPNLIYKPNENFNGDDRLIYVVNDAKADSKKAIVKFHVKAIKDKPKIVSQNQLETKEDQPIRFRVKVEDVDSDKLSYIVTAKPKNGTLTHKEEDFIYTPNENFNGNDSFEITTKDDSGEEDTQNIDVKVTSVNDAPIIDLGESKSTVVNKSLYIEPKAIDIDGNIVKYEWYEEKRVLSNNKVLKYSSNSIGNHTITLVVTDNNGATATSRVVVHIKNVPNTKPQASNLTLQTKENQSINIVLKAVDNDEDKLTYKIIQNPKYGTLSGKAPNITYSPSKNYFGVDSFTYRANDGKDDSNIAKVNIKIAEQLDNTAPVIKLNAQESITITKGYEYNEPGAIAVDDSDAEVEVEISGEVDTNRVGTYIITYTAIDKAGNKATKSRVVNVVESKSNLEPKFELNGDAIIELSDGEKFEDLGVTIVDKNKTIDITTVGSVDTNKTGIYLISYIAKDTDNGYTSVKTRVVKVNVKDTIAPKITVKGSRYLTLTKGGFYEESGAEAYDDIDGELPVDISGEVNTSKDGNYTITYSATDSSGNSASVEKTVTVKENTIQAYLQENKLHIKWTTDEVYNINISRPTRSYGQYVTPGSKEKIIPLIQNKYKAYDYTLTIYDKKHNILYKKTFNLKPLKGEQQSTREILEDTFLSFKDSLYFLVNYYDKSKDESIVELRKVDQEDSTTLVKQISISGKVSRTNMFSLGEFIYIKLANTLWKSDATENGTTKLLEDLNSNIFKIEDFIYFRNDGWLYNIDKNGTLNKIKEIKSFDMPTQKLTSSKKELYFKVWSELWKTDGTQEGTVKLSDVVYAVKDMFLFKDELYILRGAISEDDRVLLMKWDGSKFEEIEEFKTTRTMKYLFSTDKYFYIDMYYKKYRSDGTKENTKEIEANQMFNINNNVYILYAKSWYDTKLLYRYDEDSNTKEEISDFKFKDDIHDVKEVDGKFYITTASDRKYGIDKGEYYIRTFYSFDEDEGIKELYTTSNQNFGWSESMVINNQVYFISKGNKYNQKLWIGDDEQNVKKLFQSDQNETDPDNFAPVVKIKKIDRVTVGENIALFVDKLYDIDGAITEYGWYEDDKFLGKSYVYVYDTKSVGEHNITLKAVDNHGLVSTDSVIVYVDDITNHIPVCESAKIKVQENKPNSIKLKAYDKDGDDISYEIVTEPKYGKLSGTAPNLIYTFDKKSRNTKEYNYKKTNANIFYDEFRYRVNDGKDVSLTAKITLVIIPQYHLVKEEYYYKGKLGKTISYKYNSQGEKIEKSEDEDANGIADYITKYQLITNEDGTVTDIYKLDKDGDGDIDYSRTALYDKHGFQAYWKDTQRGLVYEYVYDNYGNKLVSKYYNNATTIGKYHVLTDSVYKKTYDKYANVLSEDYYSKNTIKESTSHKTITNMYDNSSNLVKSISYANYVYKNKDVDTNQVNTRISDTHTIYEYKYDENGNKIMKKQYSYDIYGIERVKYYFLYKYDENGTHTSTYNVLRNEFSVYNKPIKKVHEAYDKEGRVISTTANNNIKYLTNYTYDENGNVATKSGSTWTVYYTWEESSI